MDVVIDKNSADQRLDRFLRKWCKDYPDIKLGDIFARIRKGQIIVNGSKKKEKYRLTAGDIVTFKNSAVTDKTPIDKLADKETKKTHIDHKQLQSRIIYEDDNRIVFNKPAGIVAHGAAKHKHDLTMNDYLHAYVTKPPNQCINNPENQSITFSPAFGYRLDKDTSGVLIGAKTYDALKYINKIIRDRKIDKEYMTIVEGQFPVHSTMEESLHRKYNKAFDRAQMAVDTIGQSAKTEARHTHTTTHDILGEISLIRVKLYTGRMHQIRVHLAHHGYPILGDIIYGNPALNRKLYKQLKINRQLLHCRQYSFFDPFANKQQTFVAPLPEDFTQFISYEK